MRAGRQHGGQELVGVARPLIAIWRGKPAHRLAVGEVLADQVATLVAESHRDGHIRDVAHAGAVEPAAGQLG